MRVLFATSEATPFIKSGGLADVLGSLPKEMVKKGVESIVVLPKYQDMKLADEIEYVTSFDIWVGWRKVYCGVFTYELDGVRFYFIDEEGHDLINMIALPISSKTLLDTPPAPPTEFATTTDGLWYNNEINNIVMDNFGKCKRWGSIIFVFRVRAGDIRRPVGTAGISVYL